MGSFAPISWTDNYPAGLIQIGDDGTVKTPHRLSQQTPDNVALNRGLELLNTGSTHKLPPMKFAPPVTQPATVVPPPPSSSVESFANFNQSPAVDWPLFIVVLVLMFAFYLAH